MKKVLVFILSIITLLSLSSCSFLCEHDYDLLKTITPSTHISYGYGVYECVKCKKQIEKNIPKLSLHEYTYTSVDDVNHEMSCVCGRMVLERHDFDEGEITIPATSSSTGIKTFSCKSCSYKIEVTINKLDQSDVLPWDKIN